MLLGRCKAMGSVTTGTCAGGRRKGAGSTSPAACGSAGLRSRPALPVLVGAPLQAQQADERKAKPSLDPPGRNLSPMVTLSCHEQPKNSQGESWGRGGGHQQECCTACFCCLGSSGA